MSTATLPISAETEIRDLISAWEKAARAKDIEGIMAYHTPDMLAFDALPPMSFHSREDYAAHWSGFFTIPGVPIFEVSDLQITAGEDVAFATCFILCGGTQPDGTTFSGTARATLGFRKIGEQWHFTHEHHSVPMSGDCCGPAKEEA